jgi:hypothetical protein
VGCREVVSARGCTSLFANPLASYYSATNISLAIGAVLAVTVPLLLVDRVDDKHTRRFRDPGLTVVWLINYVSFAYLIGGILAWAADISLLAAFLAVLVPFLAWHAAVRVGRRQGAAGVAETRSLGAAKSAEDAADQLVGAILQYARILAEQQKDRALLALRASTSRTLHLLSAHGERAELGALSLPAAQRAEDLEAEASILLDDLGWANHECGHDREARQRIIEAIDLLEERLSNLGDQAPIWLRQLLIRGYRHLGGISAGDDLTAALMNIAKAEDHLTGLPDEARALEQAGLNAVYGYIVGVNYGLSHGEGAMFTDGTLEAKQVAAAMDRLQPAIALYEEVGDIERAAKTAAIYVRLARHRTSRRLREASVARLERLQRMVVRDLDRWQGSPDVRS